MMYHECCQQARYTLRSPQVEVPPRQRMRLLALALLGLKGLLLWVVVVLAVGKTISRVGSWVLNKACRGVCYCCTCG